MGPSKSEGDNDSRPRSKQLADLNFYQPGQVYQIIDEDSPFYRMFAIIIREVPHQDSENARVLCNVPLVHQGEAELLFEQEQLLFVGFAKLLPPSLPDV